MQGKSVYERIEQFVNDGSYEAAEKRRQDDLQIEASLKDTPVAQKSITTNTAISTSAVGTNTQSGEKNDYKVFLYLAVGIIVLLVFKMFLLRVLRKFKIST